MTDPASGWDARLWGLWVLYSALAYTIILGVVVGLSALGLDFTRVAIEHDIIGTLLMASSGALLYGLVLGALQWRVLSERIAMPRRSWVTACAVPALFVWLLVVVPAAIDAESSGGDLRVAYFLALSQALALGPLIGFAQATALRPYCRRWAWWIPANLLSWLFVEGLFYLLSLAFGAFDFAHGEGSPLEAFLVLLISTPLSARWLLWVTAPAALLSGGPSDR